MNSFNKSMNVVVPPITIIFLIIFLPFYLVFKFISYIRRCICLENLAGKVVLITGASSGIGVELAYEYAKKGARLSVVARRRDLLEGVANRARELGSPDVLVLCCDVSKPQDCKRSVNETVNHFGRLDHLVCNAGIAHTQVLELYQKITDALPVMDINFWGSVQCTFAAVPFLKETKGKIIVISSVTEWLPMPSSSVYNASKAALRSLFETLRTELGSDIGITIVNPGLTNSEMTRTELHDKAFFYLKFVPTVDCAKAILESARRGDMYLTVPSWVNGFFMMKLLSIDMLYWYLKVCLVNRCRKYFLSEY